MNLIKFMAYILVIFFIPSLIRPAIFSENRKVKVIAELEEIQPDFIFIGNSMLDSRIDPGYFQESTGKKIYIIWHGGIMSSVWYLIVKNVVAVSAIKPKTVFIFFRDTYLTEPTYRAGGKYKQYIDWYSGNNEEVLNRILMNERNLKFRYEDFVTKIYPLLQVNQRIRPKISKLTARMTRSISLDSFTKFEISKVNDLFNLKNFRTVAADGENTGRYRINYDFNRAVNNSFLPHMIDIAKQKKLNLVFVRIQRRPEKDSSPRQRPLLGKYISDLKKYLENQNIGYHDFTGNSEINIDMYATGDHLNKASKKKFTRIFIDTFSKNIK